MHRAAGSAGEFAARSGEVVGGVKKVVILKTGTNCAFAQRDSARDESPPQHMKVG